MRLIDHVLTIAKKIHFTDLPSLSQHPKVQYLLELPYDYILFEFYDELFDVVYNTNPQVTHEVARNPELNEKVRQLGREQEDLLRPLYSHPSAYDLFGYRKSCLLYFLRIGKREYQVMEIGRLNSIDLNINSLIANVANHIEFEVRFKVNSPKHLKAFDNVLKDWQIWGQIYNQIISLSEISYNNNTAQITILFQNDCEDFLVTLIVMLHETCGKTSINRISCH